MRSFIPLLFLLSYVASQKLVPIVRMVSKEGLSTYSLNAEETMQLEKKGFKKFEDAGFLLSPADYDKVKEKCPHLRAIIRYATNFGSAEARSAQDPKKVKTLYRLAKTYDIASKSVIGFAVADPHCGATSAVRDFMDKTQPDHIYVLASKKDRFPSYAKYVMSGTPFYVWNKGYNGTFTD